MLQHVRDFVYGENIKYENRDGVHIVKGCDSQMALREGDEIIFVNKSHCQPWIDSARIKKFGVDGMEERALLDNGTSINFEGECYIGLL